VRAGLEPALTDAAVTNVRVLDERSLRRHDGPSEDFVERLVGRRILSVKRRGKFVWMPLSSAEAVVLHLGMSGQVLLHDEEVDDPLTRIAITLERTDRKFWLNFVDQRIFGSMAIDRLVPADGGAELDGGTELIPAQVAHIARDPLDASFNEDLFLDRLRARKSGIKRALLDQSLISGIGNIYADEALWGAKLHYDQLASSLSRAASRRLLSEVRLVLSDALSKGGTSFDAQYVNVNGASGYFSQSLNAYGQQGLACSRCGTLIVRENFMNRGSHFCPRCQRLR
jgi:formamidopyrimidine-DNA glycosylase